MYTDTDGELQSFSVKDLINHNWDNKTMTTEKTYTVTSQNCVKQLSELDHGTMFIFPDKPEELCMVSNTVDGNYYFVDLTTGNLYDSQSSQHDEVNPVSYFKGRITLA